MFTKSFQIGGKVYNASMASAIDQDKILSLLTAPVMERSLAAAREGIELGNNVLVPMFMAMPTDVKNQVAVVLISKAVLHGETRNLTVDDFHGKMVEYNSLLAELLRWNLSDFFAWLPDVLKDDRAKQSQAQTP